MKKITLGTTGKEMPISLTTQIFTVGAKVNASSAKL